MRIRTIKPEFFTHEGIFELEQQTGLPIRLAFIGLWGVSDREGKFRWEPRRIGIQILPYDEVSFSDILDALKNGGFVIRSNCGAFGKIPSFLDHQCINIREAASVIPDEAFTCDHVQAHEPTYKYNGVNIQPKLRNYVFLRDGHKCTRCNATEDLTVDHIFPQSIGGSHALKNLRTFCRPCNSARPVAGKELIDDLAKDGFTLDDMESTCKHVQARVEGKGREGNKEGKGTRKESVVDALPLPFDSPDFKLFWSNWQQHRIEKKAKLTPTATKQQLERLAEMGEERAIAALKHSMANGWQGIYEPGISPSSINYKPNGKTYAERHPQDTEAAEVDFIFSNEKSTQ